MQAAFQTLIKDQKTLFLTNVDRDAMWETYLNSFEEGTERQEHNCSCCRQFIKNYGNVVAIINGVPVSIWNFEADEQFAKTVSDMNTFVLSQPIRDVFFSESKKCGTDSNRETKEDGQVIIWNHFFLDMPKEYVHSGSKSVESVMSDFRANKDVFKRSLEEIPVSTVETVLELIAQNSLYRGEEFKNILDAFLVHAKQYATLENDKDVYAWQFSTQSSNTVAKIRNSAIGTLLVDISEGKELDYAVSAFEKMVAPTNYKRPNAIVTPSMVAAAETRITELGLVDSLGRRFATPEDVSVNDLLFVNRDTAKSISGGVFEDLKEEAVVNPKQFSKTEEVSIDTFLNELLPTAKGLEILFENSQASNLVSLIAPSNAEAPTLFKWDNPFSWCYANALTDSIKEKVKAAGGRVEGELRISLSWFNYDDLDLHVIQPNGTKIWFSSPRDHQSGGHLDVDMNAGGRSSRSAVENIIFVNPATMQEGTYRVMVHNYCKRENVDEGFTIETECRGEIASFGYDRPVRNQESVSILEFHYAKATGVTYTGEAKTSYPTMEKWGLSTNKFHKVSMVMNSPNYWNNETGNKHTFFILEGAKSDESPRGFFNEFLKEELLIDKRVFEVLGGKLKVEPSEKQVSGLGFSSTQRNSVICRIEGNFKRVVKINF